MFCSAIIPTINRPTLSRSVLSVLNQECSAGQLEVIVVNDSGYDLPEMDWQRSSQVRIITTQRHERSVARNAGAAIAHGAYLYFLDDDDIMLPGAMQAFGELAQASDAAWLYGNYQIADNDGKLLEIFHPNMAGNISAFLIAGEGIPLQASLIRPKEFYRAGEFDPYFTGAQDRDLGRRLSLVAEVAKTEAVITQIRVGQMGSTTLWEMLPFFDRLGREKALNRPGAFSRLWASAKGSGFLHGRVSRAYLASAAWNIEHRRFIDAADRLISMTLFGALFVLSPEFWAGLRTRVQRLGELKRGKAPSGNYLFPMALVIFAMTVLLFLIHNHFHLMMTPR